MKKILFSIIVLITCFLLIGCKKEEGSLGSVPKITVNELVKNFSQEVFKDSKNKDNEELSYSLKNDLYWYKLADGVYLVITPDKYQNDKEKENVKMSRIYVEKDNKSDYNLYLKSLIKINNLEITDKETEDLIKSSKKYTKDKVTANNGKGISVGYIENSTHIEYQVIRVYE